MLKVFFPIFLLIVPIQLWAQSVSFTFDDGLDPTTQAQAEQWNEAILAALSAARIPSILFPIGRKVNTPAGLALVSAWSGAGHNIGNHTYTHFNLGSNAISLEGFVADVEKGHALLSGSPAWINLLRFPLLKEGNLAAKRDGMRLWMKNNDYKPASVSIDTSDWYYSSRFVAWTGKDLSADPGAFRDAYLDHIWQRAVYYDSLSQRLLGRSASHVMLLHTNAVNGAFLTDMIQMFRQKGWKIISPAEAYQDPLYRMVPDVVPAGESILWSLARQNGVADLRYPAEDSRYEEATLDQLGF